MEPISTFNLGVSVPPHNKSFPLSDLASKARQLVGNQNPIHGNRVSGSQSLNRGQHAPTISSSKDKELMDVAKKFEAILIHQMLKAMRQTVHKSELLNSFSLQQYESMMDEEIVRTSPQRQGGPVYSVSILALFYQHIVSTSCLNEILIFINCSWM